MTLSSSPETGYSGKFRVLCIFTTMIIIIPQKALSLARTVGQDHLVGVAGDLRKPAAGLWGAGVVGGPETGPGDQSHLLGSRGTGSRREFCLVFRWEMLDVCLAADDQVTRCNEVKPHISGTSGWLSQ